MLRRALLTRALLLCTAIQADMPARNDYWVDTQALVNAARALPAEDASRFAIAIDKARIPKAPPQPGHDPAFHAVRERELFEAIADLIAPLLEAGARQDVQAFLDKVNDGRWIAGHLLARNGGNFVTRLELPQGTDGRIVLRQRNNAVDPGDWKGSTFDRTLHLVR